MLLLTFTIGASRFAIDAHRVVQVVPRVKLRPLPLMETYLAGILDVSGEVVPVVDLGTRLQEAPCANRLSTRIIITSIKNESGSVPLGLVAEKVTDLRELPDSTNPRTLVGEYRLDCLGQILRIGGELIQWIDIDHVLPSHVRSVLYDVVRQQ